MRSGVPQARARRDLLPGPVQSAGYVHRLSGIALHTPADVHFGLAEAVREKRQGTLDAAYAERPDRFGRPPMAPRVPEVAWINRTDEEAPIAI